MYFAMHSFRTHMAFMQLILIAVSINCSTLVARAGEAIAVKPAPGQVAPITQADLKTELDSKFPGGRYYGSDSQQKPCVVQVGYSRGNSGDYYLDIRDAAAKGKTKDLDAATFALKTESKFKISGTQSAVQTYEIENGASLIVDNRGVKEIKFIVRAKGPERNCFVPRTAFNK